MSRDFQNNKQGRWKSVRINAALVFWLYALVVWTANLLFGQAIIKSAFVKHWWPYCDFPSCVVTLVIVHPLHSLLASWSTTLNSSFHYNLFQKSAFSNMVSFILPLFFTKFRNCFSPIFVQSHSSDKWTSVTAFGEGVVNSFMLCVLFFSKSYNFTFQNMAKTMGKVSITFKLFGMHSSYQ